MRPAFRDATPRSSSLKRGRCCGTWVARTAPSVARPGRENPWPLLTATRSGSAPCACSSRCRAARLDGHRLDLSPDWSHRLGSWLGEARSIRLTATALKEQYRHLFMSNRTAARVLCVRVAVRLSLLVLLLLGFCPGGSRPRPLGNPGQKRAPGEKPGVFFWPLAEERVQRTGAQILWECLVKEGVNTVFGYPGGAILPAYDAMLDYPDPPRAGAPRAGRRAHGRRLRARDAARSAWRSPPPARARPTW